MNDNKFKPMSDHDYDGITELDNNLPQWWVWLFVLCCVWALGYMVYFHAMGGPSQLEEYQREISATQAVKPPVSPGSDIRAAVALADEPSADEAVIASGKDLYLKNCMVCHTADGGGLIGPNLCDDFFIHGSLFADSIRTIEEGVLAKGMIAWKGVLKPEEIHAVASYIFTLRGTTPANPKPPEGTQANL